MTITLEAIKGAQAELAQMIDKFEAQAMTSYVFPETAISLKPGEHYAGIIIGKDGESSHHLILMPGEIENERWQRAMEISHSMGGDLPTRREQALLYANLKEQFKGEWYWSSEQHASHSDCAWCQDFYNGSQDFISKHHELRARAVRRLNIEG